MTRVALDSNVLIYAELEPGTSKGKRAADVILRVSVDGVIPVQVLGEYLRVVQRRAPADLASAIQQSELYRATFITPVTSESVFDAAAGDALAHGLQFWDAVVCAAAVSAGAGVLLTEDMQDGRVLNGMRLINPFNPTNSVLLDGLLAP